MSEDTPEHVCALYLCMQVGASPESIQRIEALLDTGKIGCLLLKAPTDASINPQNALALANAAQQRNIATLIQDDAQLARTIKADGVHLTWSEDVLARFTDAKEIVGSSAIVGADAGRSRHIAMSLGEADAHYIAFGIPDFVSDVEKAQKRQTELVGWWGEIFQIPCVAFNVPNTDRIESLAANKADFIAVDLPQGKSNPDLSDWLNTQYAALTATKDE